jgi:hypothetical protein
VFRAIGDAGQAGSNLISKAQFGAPDDPVQQLIYEEHYFGASLVASELAGQGLGLLGKTRIAGKIGAAGRTAKVRVGGWLSKQTSKVRIPVLLPGVEGGGLLWLKPREGAGAAGGAAGSASKRLVVGDSNLFQDRPGALGARSIADNILAEESLEILVPKSVLEEVNATPSQLARLRSAKATVTVIPDVEVSQLAAQHVPTRAAPSFLSRKFGANDAILAGAGSQRGIPILTTNERLAGQVASRPAALPNVRVLRVGIDVTGPEDLLPLLGGTQ